MAGSYLKDRPLLTDLRAEDEVYVERVEGDLRTGGRMTIDNLLGAFIPVPQIVSPSQSGSTVSLSAPTPLFESYSKVKIDGTLYPSETVDSNQINVDITGLAAGEHSYVVYNLYKQSAAYLFTTT